MKFKDLKAISGAQNLVVLGFAVMAAGGASVWGLCAFQVHRAVAKAEAQLQKGYAALAVETLDPHRRSAIRHAKGCNVMISAYYQARRSERLDWVSQACLESGKEIPEAYMGLAGARELIGRDAEALQVLSQAAPKFDKIPDIYYTAAQIQRRLRRDQEALQNFGRAIERAPENNQLRLEVLEYAVGLQQWEIAKNLAAKLRTVQTDNPEVKLFLARVFYKGGDAPSGQALVAEAKQMLAQKPETMRAAVEKAYADVFSGQVTPASAERNLATEKK